VESSFRAIPLTEDNFYAFGEVLTSTDATDLKPGQRQIWNASIYNSKTEANVVFSYLHAPQATIPHVAAQFEKFSCSQTYISLTKQNYLLLVALPSKLGNFPNLLTFAAFVVHGEQVVNIKPGIWHHKIVTVGAPGDILVLSHEGATTDTSTIKGLKLMINI